MPQKQLDEISERITKLETAIKLANERTRVMHKTLHNHRRALVEVLDGLQELAQEDHWTPRTHQGRRLLQTIAKNIHDAIIAL